MDIITVKANIDGGYIVNDEVNVPNADGNRHFAMVQEWIANGGAVEPFETQAEIDARLIEENNAQAKADLEKIDLESIRAMREWIASQPNAPQFVLDHEAQAQSARARIIK